MRACKCVLACVCDVCVMNCAMCASSFGEKVLADQAALQQLNDAGYKSLQQRLRVRAPTQPNARMPCTGLAGTDGTTELPGPQPGMPVMEMHQVQAPDAPARAESIEHPTAHSDDESAPDLSQMTRKQKKAHYEKLRRKRRLPEAKEKDNKARRDRHEKVRRLAATSVTDAAG